MSIADALKRVLEDLRAQERAAGRPEGSVRLVAVGKTFPASALAEAYAAGQRAFGENRAQELRDKAPLLPADVEWHFIGQLQTNKAKYVAPLAHRVHALETLEQAQALAARSSRPVPCLVEVNIGREPQKAGVAPEQTLERCADLVAQGAITLRGLMCVPPYNDDPRASTPHFEALARLAEQGRAAGLPLHELSMGMSHDYAQAIQAGATWVRVGTAIFGQRG